MAGMICVWARRRRRRDAFASCQADDDAPRAKQPASTRRALWVLTLGSRDHPA